MMRVRQGYTVVCPMSEVYVWKGLLPDLTYKDIHTIAKSRRFIRWVANNQKALNTMALLTPITVLALYQISPEMLSTLYTFQQPEAVTAMASVPPSTYPYQDTHTGNHSPTSFFSGHGAILLHMLVVGFVTLVITSFLKFTGRGDIVPLVAFVGGGVILYEVLGLFKDIYHEVETFLNL